jgi:hypothetical protein
VTVHPPSTPAGSPTPVPAPRWQRRADTGWRATLVGLVLLPGGRSEPVTLAGSAGALWAELAHPTTEEDLAHRLADQFDADPDQVATDLRPLLDQLLDLGAVQKVSGELF